MYSLVSLRCPEDSGSVALRKSKHSRTVTPLLAINGRSGACGVQFNTSDRGNSGRVSFPMDALAGI